MQIIYKHWNMRIADLRSQTWTIVNCWQYMPLKVAHDLIMITLISDSQFIWRLMMLILCNHEKINYKPNIGLSAICVHAKPHLYTHWKSEKYFTISAEMAQFHGCWCPGSSHRQVISMHIHVVYVLRLNVSYICFIQLNLYCFLFISAGQELYRS